MPESIEGLKIGSSASYEKQITEEDIVSFAEVTGDSNPLHTDTEYAARTRFQQPIAHGMLGAGLISAAIGANLAPGKAVIYLGQTLQFRAPVIPGDIIVANVEVIEIDTERNRLKLTTNVTNQDGTDVIRGVANIMVEALVDA